ncbi:hypothetical protein CR513_26621, partial [Mucuna pruriens]
MQERNWKGVLHNNMLNCVIIVRRLGDLIQVQGFLCLLTNKIKMKIQSPFGGILLVAVARDPNDQYFPLIVVVEYENKDSWSWFLTNFLDHIGRDRSLFFTNKRYAHICLFDNFLIHKSMFANILCFFIEQELFPIIHELLEVCEHRTCVKHAYANMKKHYGSGSVPRDRMLVACKVTYYATWEKRMVGLKVVSKEAHD